MTYDELAQIKRDAEIAGRASTLAKLTAEEIGEVRRSHLPEIDEVELPFSCGWRSGRRLGGDATAAVKQATLDLLPDILRLAEMRLEAESRHQSALARARNAQVADFLGEPS